MKVISKTIYLSVFSLVCPAISFASLPSAYASLVDTSQNQTFESEPSAPGAIFLSSQEPAHSFKLANVKFIIGDRDLDFGERNFAEKDLCQMQGFRLTSCPVGYIKGEVCPYDSKLIKECIAPVSWCKSNGYDVTSCTVPKYPTNPCPYLSSLYKSCEVDNIRACKEAGYSLTCETGRIGDQSCPYNSSYKKCVCNPCKGYAYTAAQASAQGYAPGEVCNSCGTIKYKRTENKCAGYQSCDCGGESGAKVCYSGSVKKYNSCKSCCDSKYQYDSSNCTGGKILAGSSCGGKYDTCQEPTKIGDIVYGDGSTSSNLVSGKTPIGVVFDISNRLAMALNGAKKDGSLGYEAMAMATDNCYSACDSISIASCQTEAGIVSCDVDGRKNTNKLLQAASSCQGTYPAANAANKFQPLGCERDFCKKGNWFIPSMRDLNKIYTSKASLNKALTLTKSWNSQTLSPDKEVSTNGKAVKYNSDGYEYLWSSNCGNYGTTSWILNIYANYAWASARNTEGLTTGRYGNYLRPVVKY